MLTSGRSLVQAAMATFAATAACTQAVPARAHEAPTGWSYPFSCCSGYDCRPVKASAIRAIADGYLIQPSGEVVVYSDSRIKRSPDGDYHWCSVAGKDNGRTICLFVPPQLY